MFLLPRVLEGTYALDSWWLLNMMCLWGLVVRNTVFGGFTIIFGVEIGRFEHSGYQGARFRPTAAPTPRVQAGCVLWGSWMVSTIVRGI